jgi:hypothetical protein
VIGTPHARWRLSTQSGRPSTIEPIRLRPFLGHEAASGRSRASPPGAASRRARRAAFVVPALLGARSTGVDRAGLSIGTNHCGVQRKITLAFERHEWG